VDVGKLRGKPVVVVFWASWCLACKREMPGLKELYDAHHKDGLEVVGVNLDKKTAAAEEYVKKSQLAWPNVHFRAAGDKEAENPVAQQYGIREIPATFVLDRQGVVVSGNPSAAAVRAVVTALLAEGAKKG